MSWYVNRQTMGMSRKPSRLGMATVMKYTFNRRAGVCCHFGLFAARLSQQQNFLPKVLTLPLRAVKFASSLETSPRTGNEMLQ